MFEKIVPEVLAKYGLQYLAVGAVQKGYRNESYAVTLADGAMVNLMFFKREPRILARIKRADATSRYAADAGLSVRTRHDQRLLQVRADTYAGLYTYLPGGTIAWEMYSMKHIKLLGWAMSDLHAALVLMPVPDAHTVYAELRDIVDEMQHYFSRTGVRSALRSKLYLTVELTQFDDAQKCIETLAGLPGGQMLHMDMVRGNLLFGDTHAGDIWKIGDTALSGIIDFEKAAYGQPVFDVARTLAFLLVDCPKPTEKTYKYFVESGYSKRGKATLEYMDHLPPLVRLFLLHDFYKFLKHTPYESLADNRHYVRTRDLLKKYGMISPKK